MRNFLPLVGEHEGARTVGRLGLAEGKTSLPDRCRLLVTGQPADWNLAAEPSGMAPCQFAVCIDHTWERRLRDAEQFAQIAIELRTIQRQQQGAAGIAGIGDMVAARKLVDQPALDGAESEPAGLRGAAHRLVIVEHPAHLGAREIGIEQQAGPPLDLRLVTVILHARTELGGSPVLPHNRARKRIAALAVPCDHRLALVGYSDRRDRARITSDNLARASQRALPDLGRIVFDPAGTRIMLGQFGLRDAFQPSVAGEDHSPRRRGPGVQYENAIGHALSHANGRW